MLLLQSTNMDVQCVAFAFHGRWGLQSSPDVLMRKSVVEAAFALVPGVAHEMTACQDLRTAVWQHVLNCLPPGVGLTNEIRKRVPIVSLLATVNCVSTVCCAQVSQNICGTVAKCDFLHKLITTFDRDEIARSALVTLAIVAALVSMLVVASS